MFGNANKNVVKELNDLSAYKDAAFRGSAVAMMVVDRDIKVLVVNEATKRLLHDNAQAFRTIWPSFNPDAIAGACIAAKFLDVAVLHSLCGEGAVQRQQP